MAEQDTIQRLVTALGPKHPEHKEWYSNTTRIGVTPWDVHIVFGHVIEHGPAQQNIEDLVSIVMSPQHAKVLLGQWAQAIQTYEAQFGPIPDLAQIVAQMVQKGAGA